MSEMAFISKANIGFGLASRLAVQTILFRVQCLQRLYEVHTYVPTYMGFDFLCFYNFI